MRKFSPTFLWMFFVFLSCTETPSLKEDRSSSIETISDETAPYLVSEYGDTITTGVPIRLIGEKQPLITSSVSSQTLENPPRQWKPKNVPLSAGKPKIIPLRDVRPLQTKSSNSKPPKDTLIQGDKAKVSFPKATVANAPLYRDNAAVDVQWMDVDQGLNSAYVVFNFEDSKGYIWIGYYGGGLSRFDGEEFYHFTEEEGLLNNYVWTIFEDSKGNLWFGHYYGGLTKYDGINFTHYTLENGFPDKTVWSIIEDTNQNIWFGTMNGAVRYRDNVFTHFTTENGLIGNSIAAMIQDSSGNIWFGTKGSGVSVYDGQSFASYTVNDGLPDNKILSLYEDINKNIWIGTNEGGVSKYDGEFLHIFTENEGLAHNKVISIVGDTHDNIWFATHGGGLSKYDGTSFYNITKSEGLPHNELRSLMVDSKNNLWAGTEGAGLFKFNPDTFSYRTPQTGLPHEQVYSIYNDTNGNIWLGTFGQGLCKYDGIQYLCFSKEQGFPSENVISITEDRKGNIWFGTFDQGVFKFDGKIFTQFNTDSGLRSNMIWSILEDKSGYLWFGTELGGLTRFDGTEFTHFSLGEKFPTHTVWDIMEDRKGILWFATNTGGLCKYDDGYFTFYTQNEGLPHDIVWSVLEDQQNNIWAGTQKGITRFDGEHFKNFTEKDGLSSNVVWSVLEDSKGNIWSGTNKGLNCIVYDTDAILQIDYSETIDEGTAHISSYYKNDGLKSVIFYANSAAVDNNNTLWFGNISGVLNANLDQFGFVHSPPAVQLNTIHINQKNIDYNRLHDVINDETSTFLKELGENAVGIEKFQNYPTNLSLPHYFNHLTFKFSGIDWAAPHKVVYSYKISGLDEEWSVSNAENKADYRNIPPGTYTFMVKGLGSSGQWSEPLSYPFSIASPWWLTNWAISSYILSCIFLLTVAFLWYSKRMIRKQLVLEEMVQARTHVIQKQKIEVENQQEELSRAYIELEKERNKMELKALLNQINPHFIFNALNSIQQFIMNNNTKSSLDYFSKFGKLMRSSLEHSELKFVSLYDETDVIKNYVDLENLRFKTPILLTFETGTIDIYNVKIPPMFIQPLVENAILHGLNSKKGERKINIKFEDNDAYIMCLVRDNGVGRSENTTAKSRINSGLIITQKRLKSIWTNEAKYLSIKFRDLKDDSMKPLGTEVKIKLPKQF